MLTVEWFPSLESYTLESDFSILLHFVFCNFICNILNPETMRVNGRGRDAG